MTHITNPKQLPSVDKIAAAETAKVAVLRPTKHFAIETPDNPDMVRTLETQQALFEQKIAEVPPESKEALRQKLKKEFKEAESQKALDAQTLLITKMKEQGIPIRVICEDKGELKKAQYDYYTDQIFATDTGQYYDKGGVLQFIAASFKNKQRQGEERLAIDQAENLGANVQTLYSNEGKKLTFEGGDIRQMIGKKLFFIGQGHRSDPNVSKAVANMSGYDVLPIHLLQEQFYHLDCCFMPLPCDAAVLYEGEYFYDESHQLMCDEQGWPQIVPGSETMTKESRALIRTIYPPDKLVLISKTEALAYATNAVVLQNPVNGKFKMFVNGDSEANISDEVEAIMKQQISFSTENKHAILLVTEGTMDIVEVPYSIMHGSGGSVRCTVLELACTVPAITPHRETPHYFSNAIDKMEAKLHKKDKAARWMQFFEKEKKADAYQPEASRMLAA